MRICPHRLVLAEQWIQQNDEGQQGKQEITLVIALLCSVVCLSNDCSEHICLAQVEAMSEGEFMDYVLEQMHLGHRQPFSRLTAAELAAIEEEQIGAEFSRYPFLY